MLEREAEGERLHLSFVKLIFRDCDAERKMVGKTFEDKIL